MTPTFEQFVTARMGALRSYALVLSADDELAAALVEKALIRTGLAWSRVVRDGNPEAYVRATVVALYLSRWTNRHDRPDGSGGGALSRSERRRRTAIVLSHDDELSAAEIARLVGRSERWVRQVVGRLEHPVEMGSRSPASTGHTRRLWAMSR